MTKADGLLDAQEIEFLMAPGSGSDDGGKGKDPVPEQEVTMRGDLEQIELADIFQTLAMSKMEGMLRVRNPLEQREVFFREGMVRCLVPARIEVRRLGQMLIRAGLIDSEQLRAALLVQKKIRKPIGHVLIEEGVVTEEQVEDVANRQITEDLYNLFTWQHGSFEFYRGPCSDPLLAQRLAQLPEFDVKGVLLEVARRLDEWVVILEAVRSLDEVPVRTGLEEPESLDKDHRAVLQAVDGHLNIRELADTCLMGLFDCARVVRDHYAHGTLEPASTEQVVKVAEAWLSSGEMKRALVTVQTLYDRPEERDLDTIVMVGDLLQRCGESRLAGNVLLDAAQRTTEPLETLKLARRARELDPRNPEILSLLQQGLRESDGSKTELMAVTAALVDALRDEGHLEEALAITDELEQLDPGGVAVLTRKSRLLHRLKRPNEAIKVLEALAAIHEATKDREQLIGTYEQILKIDHGRKDIARTLKTLHAGKLGSYRRVGLGVGTILTACAVGFWVIQTQKQTTALDVVSLQISKHLNSNQPEVARQLLAEFEATHGQTPELQRIRVRIGDRIRAASLNRDLAMDRKRLARLAKAGELMNEGKCVEAMVVYSQLVRNSPKGIRVRETLEVRVASLTTKFEKLARELRHSVPDPPDPIMVVATLETVLAELKARFPDEYLQTSEGVLAAKDNEQFNALVSEESRTRLLEAAQAIVNRFEEAHIRRDEYRSKVQTEKVTLALAPVFERARNYEVKGDHKKALAAYRRLKKDYPIRDSLSQRFEERVEFYSTLIRYLEIIERATAQGNYRVARNQYRALKQQYPAQKFPNLRLPVWVETTPSNARVYLNGTEMGTSPIKLAYSPINQTTIRVELDGFHPEEARLVDDANDKVVSLLSRKPDWAIDLPGSLEHTPVADSEGRVFFADRSGTVTAVDSNTGKVIWTFKTRDMSGLHPRPLIYGDRLIVASIDGTLRSLDLQTGRLDWSREDVPSEIAPVACGSTVVLVTTKNKLVGLHPGAIKINYSVQLRGRVRAAPVAIAHHVFTVTTSGRVVKFVGSNGKRAWLEPSTVGQIILAEPIPTRRGLLFPGGDGSLTLLNPQSGQEIWRQTGLGDLSAPVMVRDDTVFLAQEREVAARSLADGSLIGSLESETEWTSPPAVLADRLLVGNREGQVHVFDAKTLKRLYQIRIRGRIVAAPVLVSRTVLVVASETGRVFGFTTFP